MKKKHGIIIAIILVLVYFGTLIDEPNPSDPAKEAQVKFICNAWNKLLVEIAGELKNNSKFMANDALAKAIIEDVKHIEHIVVGYKHGDHKEAFSEVDATWCPTNDYFMIGRELYEKQNERWWYTMLVPYAPYSTYWKNLGNVEYAAFYFGEKGDSARNIYFGNIYLTTLNMEGGE